MVTLTKRAERAFELNQQVQQGKEDARNGLLRILMALDILERTGLFKFHVTEVEEEEARLHQRYRALEPVRREEIVNSLLFSKYLNETAKVGNPKYVRDKLRAYRVFVKELQLTADEFNSVDTHHLISLIGAATKLIKDKGQKEAKEIIVDLIMREEPFSRPEFQRYVEKLREGKIPRIIDNCGHTKTILLQRCVFCGETEVIHEEEVIKAKG